MSSVKNLYKITEKRNRNFVHLEEARVTYENCKKVVCSLYFEGRMYNIINAIIKTT